MVKFKQIGPRVTELKASISRIDRYQKESMNISFKIIERALDQMTNLKSLELDSDPYFLREDSVMSLRLYPLDKIEAIKGLEKLKFVQSEFRKSMEG